MKNFHANPKELTASFWRNRALIRSMVHREVAGRYKGSMLGIFWSLVTPIFMLTVYTFVFSIVFKARWNTGSESQTEFALILFAGLLVFNLFGECISRAPGLILSNVNYVKKVVFPLEILPWVSMGSAIFHFTVSFIVWLIAYSLLIGAPHWTVIFTPLIIAPFALFVMGLSWFLASLGVYLRDVGQLIGIIIQVTMFLTPIFYPIAALPIKLQPLLKLNPLTTPIEMMRDAMYWGNAPSISSWLIGSLVSTAVAAAGFAWFQKTRKGFSDVI